MYALERAYYAGVCAWSSLIFQVLCSLTHITLFWFCYFNLDQLEICDLALRRLLTAEDSPVVIELGIQTDSLLPPRHKTYGQHHTAESDR